MVALDAPVQLRDAAAPFADTIPSFAAALDGAKGADAHSVVDLLGQHLSVPSTASIDDASRAAAVPCRTFLPGAGFSATTRSFSAFDPDTAAEQAHAERPQTSNPEASCEDDVAQFGRRFETQAGPGRTEGFRQWRLQSHGGDRGRRLLSEALPQYDQVDCECDLDPDRLVPCLLALSTPWPVAPLKQGDVIDDLFWTTRLAFQLVQPATLACCSGSLWARDHDRHHQIRAFHIYTDGSHADEDTTWAVVVLAQTDQGTLFRLGHFAGRVVVGNGALHQHLGAESCSSYTAELSALAWASMFLLQLPVCPASSIHYDALSAGMCAQGEWQGQSEQQLLAVTRALLDMVRFRTELGLHHVKAHTGHPWNEYADRAAAGAARPGQDDFDQNFVADPLRLSTPHRLMWAVALVTGQLAGPQYPPIIGTTLLACSSRPPCSDVPPLHRKTGSRAGGARHDHETPFTINMLQANVLTMAERNVKTNDSDDPVHVARRVYLDRAFREASLQVCGLQECRTRTGTLQTESFLVWKGGADQHGQFGCELWIARSLNMCGRTVDVQRDNVIVVHAEPRCLVANLFLPSWSCTFVVGHAPVSSAPRASIKAFWTQLSRHATVASASTADMCLLVDANARVGSRTSPCIGEHAADLEDFSGKQLHGFLEHHGLALPSTFSAAHRGDRHHTWQGKAEAHRIDFIGIPFRWLAGACSVVRDDIDIVIRRRDHWPVSAQASPPLGEGSSLIKHRSAIISRSLTKDPGANKTFVSLVSTLPPPDWEQHVDDHWEQTRALLTDSAKVAYPLKQATPKKSWLTDASWHALRYRAELRKSSRQAWQDRRLLVLRWVFRALRPGTPLQVDMVTYTSIHDAATMLLELAAYISSLLSAGDASLRSQLRSEKEAVVNEVASRADRAAKQGDSRELHASSTTRPSRRSSA